MLSILQLNMNVCLGQIFFSVLTFLFLFLVFIEFMHYLHDYPNWFISRASYETQITICKLRVYNFLIPAIYPGGLNERKHPSL